MFEILVDEKTGNDGGGARCAPILYGKTVYPT
jgi:hypothetical protein